MRRSTSSLLFIFAVGAVLTVSATALADPPGRVGRLSYTEGVVSFHTADQDQWSPTTLNYPVAAGESFWTEPGARAEIEVGSTEIRLDETTLLDIAALDDGSTRLQLDQGVLSIHIRALPPGGIQVQTPRGEVNLVEPGSYHLDAGHPDGNAPPAPTEVTVLEGKAETQGPRSPIEILPGETASIAGEPVSVTLREGNPTPFDDWALARDRREVAIQTTRYVSPEATGYRDLDNYGRWTTDPTYGAAWYPTDVETGWAPYRYGHWAYVAPWGWTWIDDAPWGFTPFHYGRWVVIDDAWAWVPGTIVPRPIYAPALVAFVGGAGFGVTIAAEAPLAAVGWVPLAPFEVYRPYYPTSVAYVRNVNITNVNKTVVNNITTVTVNKTVVVNNFVNQQAATVVPAAAFTQAASVQRTSVAVPHEQLARAQVASSVAHLQPTAAAKAGIAQPAVATAVLPHANAPATIAPHLVQAPATSQASADAAIVPKAPAPRVRAMAAPTPQLGRAAPASLPPAARTAPPPPHNLTSPAQAAMPQPPTKAAAPQPAVKPMAQQPPATAAPRSSTATVQPAPQYAAPPAGSAPGPAISHSQVAAPQPTVSAATTAHPPTSASQPTAPHAGGAPGPAITHSQPVPASSAVSSQPRPSGDQVHDQQPERPTSSPGTSPRAVSLAAPKPQHPAQPVGGAPGPTVTRSQTSAPQPPVPAAAAHAMPPATRPAPQPATPGAAIAHNQAPAAPQASNAPTAQGRPPAPSMQRPQQQTQLAPTPSGWVRAPMPPAPQHTPAAVVTPQAAPKSAPKPPEQVQHPAQSRDERKQGGQ